jgi:hypothetical protein
LVIDMAKRGRDAGSHDGVRATIARRAWRLSVWSGLTIVSIAAAVLAAFSDPGARRLALGDTATASEPARSPGSDIENRRLADAVRALTADRDRLAARVSALERSLDDVTGSIPSRPDGNRSAANPAASPLPPALAPRPTVNAEPARAPSPPPATAAPATVPAPGSAQTPAAAPPGRAASWAPIAGDTGAAASTATRTEFGIDLGTAATVEGLRSLWDAIKGSQAPLIEGLRPVVAVRDGAKPGALELRLVVGPLANAGVAARLCAALADAGLTCAPAVFDGQRLALK